MKPRDYQIDAHAAICSELATKRSTLAVLATGLGKTVLFAMVIKTFLERFPGRRVLVIAHREELIHQAARKIAQVTGIIPDIEMGELRANEGLMPSPIVVATVQTLAAGRADSKRLHRFDAQDFGLLIIDEAHHATADSYRAVIDWIRTHPDSKILGVTATPGRGDGVKLGHIFETIAYSMNILDGIMLGWLADVRQEMVYIEGLDFSEIRTRNGDFAPEELAAVLEAEKPLHEIAGATLERREGRKTLVFAASVAQAEGLTDIFNRYAPASARILTGKTDRDERRNMLREYAAGAFEILCNVGVATEGFDEPTIGCVVMARPTKSAALYAQCLGRGTRPLAHVIDGITDAEERVARIRNSPKPNVLVLDFVGNAGKHQLVSSVDVLGDGSEPEVIERARRRLADAGSEPVEIRTVLREAEEEAAAEKERQARIQAERDRRAGIRATVSSTTKTVCPFRALGLTPSAPFGVKFTPATARQVAFLTKWGINANGMSSADANKVTNEVFRRIRNGLATPKQANLLRKYNLNPNMKFDEARAIIDTLAKNGWKMPTKETA